MISKPVVFIGSSYSAIKHFPEQARKAAGWQLQAVQKGHLPNDWKPIPIVGPGVKEIRVHQTNEYRVIYVANFPESIYVLSAFIKKTEKTPRKYIEIARAAYAKVKEMRGQGIAISRKNRL